MNGPLGPAHLPLVLPADIYMVSIQVKEVQSLGVCVTEASEESEHERMRQATRAREEVRTEGKRQRGVRSKAIMGRGEERL